MEIDFRESIKKLIEKEGDRYEFEYKGYKCKVLRMPKYLHLCGYITIPVGHVWYDKDLDCGNYDIYVHGGITYAEYEKHNGKEEFVIGFDCAHVGDYSLNEWRALLSYDDVYRTKEYVISEIKHLVDQAIEADV